MPFYLIKNGQQVGPFDRDQILELVRSGAFSANDLVCEEGTKDWQPLGIVFPGSAPTQLRKSPLDALDVLWSDNLLIAAVVVLCVAIVVSFIGLIGAKQCSESLFPSEACPAVPLIQMIGGGGFLLCIAFLIGGLVRKNR